MDRAELIRRGRQASSVVDNAEGKNALIRDLCDALEAAPAVPDGWKLVPVEPTEAMRKAWNAHPSNDSSYFSENFYRAMLAAAPEAPGQEARDDWTADPARNIDLSPSAQDGLHALEELANLPLGIPLADWSRLSSRIQAGLEAGVASSSPAAEPVALASARQEGFEAGIEAAAEIVLPTFGDPNERIRHALRYDILALKEGPSS